MKKIIILISVFLSFAASESCLSQIPAEFTDPLFGGNVFVFDPSMNMAEIQSCIDTVFNRMGGGKSEFSTNRYAFLFKPGKYMLDIRIGYYTVAMGLGASPEDVVITGAVRSNTTHHNSVLTNFWRGVENLTIIPSPDSADIWGVSQAAPMRRVHIKGNLQLFDKGYASGGFLADSKIDGVISSGPQQQWLTRNSEIGRWKGGNWNMMFMGVKGAPAENWPEGPYTTIKNVPVIREKPFITFENGSYDVRMPLLRKNSEGVSWKDKSGDKIISLKDFYIVKEGKDNAESINRALEAGKNLIITPGIYKLDKSIRIERKGSIILGIGMPSLMPVNGTPAIESDDPGGITIAGLLIDAGPQFSESLFTMGKEASSSLNPSNPSFLFDIFFRVGGPSEGSAKACLTINSSNVYVDHTWIWRADHGNGVGWNRNKAANGLVVNGNNVTVYGLFNEHFQEYQTLWKGEGGRVYFYQSEMPYDPPTPQAWSHDGVNGYASYKVADNVKDHEAWGLGIYNVFYDAPVIEDHAIETPTELEPRIHNKIIFWLNGNKESVVRSIINGKGGSVNVSNRKAVMK